MRRPQSRARALWTTGGHRIYWDLQDPVSPPPPLTSGTKAPSSPGTLEDLRGDKGLGERRSLSESELRSLIAPLITLAALLLPWPTLGVPVGGRTATLTMQTGVVLTLESVGFSKVIQPGEA